jgi:hypothetical protein
LDEQRHRTGVDDDLSVSRSTRCDVWTRTRSTRGDFSATEIYDPGTPKNKRKLTGQSPSRLELQHAVTARQELYEPRYDSAFDHAIYRRVLLL